MKANEICKSRRCVYKIFALQTGATYQKAPTVDVISMNLAGFKLVIHDIGTDNIHYVTTEDIKFHFV
jgi:hypothetical protein